MRGNAPSLRVSPTLGPSALIFAMRQQPDKRELFAQGRFAVTQKGQRHLLHVPRMLILVARTVR